MQRPSPSIGTLASALAKAQGELVNQEKFLVATIRGDGPSGTGQTFRHAPLPSALDIVRKILGRHEIATVQTTSIDQAAGIINLTTVLAHASGNGSPRTGRSAPSARLPCSRSCVLLARTTSTRLLSRRRPIERLVLKIRKDRATEGSTAPSIGCFPTAGAMQEAMPQPLRFFRPKHRHQYMIDRLIAEVHGLGSGVEAAVWAHRSLAEKNKSTAADAQALEEAFQARLDVLAVSDVDVSEATDPAGAPPTSHQRKKATQERRSRPEASTRAYWPYPNPAGYVTGITSDLSPGKSLPDLRSTTYGRPPSPVCARHTPYGRKVSDEFAVPLCRGHHRKVHRCGDEPAWWNGTGVDPTNAARLLWLESHPPATH
jgi:hypothetical protein